ncbi:MAG TPA: class I SAM-dependent methyltransferase [Gemmatimonadaceae bacterium]
MTVTTTPPAVHEALHSSGDLSGPVAAVARLFDLAGIDCEITQPGGVRARIGRGEPQFRVVCHTRDAFARGLDERSIAEAYLDGEFDLEGDMLRAFDVRTQLADKVPVSQFLRVWLGHFLRRRTRVNREAIDFHYSLGDDFYLAFLDSAYRIYTHAIYRHDNEPLEVAAERKMEQAFRSLNLRPGMRVLNVGAGWGPTEQYFGSRGVHVTGLTIGEDSRQFVQRLIERERLTAEVKLEDFLVHRPERPYDALVILGVIEHIPDYRRFARQAWEVLKPGALIYLDASASIEKYSVSSFAREHVWAATHTYMVLQDLIRELLYHGIDVLEVANETRDYGLTCTAWAQRFDAARDHIVRGWGERVWRTWRLYLWGGAHAFLRNELQAYHMVARRSDRPGPRPGSWRRFINAVKSVV